MRINEYFIDTETITREMEKWLVDNGARVVDTGKRDWKGGREIPIMDVYIGPRKIHFMAGSSGARLFFDDSTKDIGLLFILMYPDKVCAHNLNRNEDYAV